MKVVQSLSFYPKTGGGAEVIINELSGALKNIGVDVLLVTQNDKTGLDTTKNIPTFHIKSVGDRHIYFPDFSIKNFNKLFSQLNKFSPDIVHIHNIMSLDFVIYLWAIIHNIPIVSTLHIVPSRIHRFVDFNKIAEKFLKLNIFKKYLTMILKNSTGIIALNDVIVNELKVLNINTNIFKINNGRYIKKFLPKLLLSIKSDKINLLFLGHISKRKNQLYLIEVMRYLPDYYFLTLVGGVSSNKYLHKIKNKIKNYSLTNVELLGLVNQDEVIKILHKTHLFVSASKAEVQSLVIIEALASKTPIVGLSNETTQKLVNNNVGKLLPISTDPRQFAQEIVNIVSNNNIYNKLCDNAVNQVSKFDWNIVSEKTLNSYRKIIKIYKDNQKQKSYFFNFTLFIKKVKLILVLPIIWFFSKVIRCFYKIKEK